MGQGKIVLVPANKRYKPIEIDQESDFTVWGVVTYAIKRSEAAAGRPSHFTPSNIPAREPQRPRGHGQHATRKTMYGLCDCNNFFASCERVFRPELEGRPVVVLSNNDGCVIARSNEAKALGIRMGHPYFQIRDLENGIM